MTEGPAFDSRQEKEFFLFSITSIPGPSSLLYRSVKLTTHIDPVTS
jgi:hypothetical protein